MTKVAITHGPSGLRDGEFRATTRGRESVGRTPGAALDALTQQLDESERNSFIIVQNMQADEFFTAPQQQRLSELLAKRRAVLDGGGAMDPADNVELEALINAELDGAAQRASAMVSELRS